MKKQKAVETFAITDGPKHPFDLALCLIDPYPKPQQMFHGYSGGTRHPGFIMNIDGIHDKHQNKKRERVIQHLRVYWQKPPIRITSLSKGNTEGHWDFKGIPTVPSGTVGGQHPEARAWGWYNVNTCKGRISFSEPKTRE